MNKEQFLKLVKIKGKLNFLGRLKAVAETDPQKAQTVKPSKQDYMKAAGQVLGEMAEKADRQSKPLGTPETLPETAHAPYIGFALDYKKHAYWVYLINPSPTLEYEKIDLFTGAFAEDFQTGRAYKQLGGLKPLSVMLLEQSDIDGLDFVIWFHLDLFTKDGVNIQTWFSLPKYAGFGNSEKQQRVLDCGIYALKILLNKRDGKTVLEEAEEEKQKENNIQFNN